MGGQGDAERLKEGRGRPHGRATLALLAWGLLAASWAAAAWAADRPTPSGLPVPRYVSLKFDTVNARAGPGDDHRLLWVYRARGLPLQVVAETAEWRRVCDPEGGLVWVHRRTVDLRRTVMNLSPRPAPLRRKAKPDAAITAYLAPRALATLVRCEGGWCAIRVDGAKGWSPQGELWGAADKPQCR